MLKHVGSTDSLSEPAVMKGLDAKAPLVKTSEIRYKETKIGFIVYCRQIILDMIIGIP